MKRHPMFVLTLTAALGLPMASAATPDAECVMHFDLSSWAVLYKHASGHGTITCKDGASMKVKLRANGGGLALSKSTVKDGRANFTGLRSINDALGTYVAAAADTGLVKHGDAQVLTKGEVSMSLVGAGEGVGLGVTVGGFTIAREP